MKPLTPSSPHVIIMVGIPGAGKTAFAQHFADTFAAPFINEFASARELNLNTTQQAGVTKLLLGELLKVNKTLIFEGDTHTRISRERLAKRVTSAGYRPLLVWVQTESSEAKRRAVKPYPKGSGLTPNEFDDAISRFQPPVSKEGAIVISGKHTYATQLKVVLKHLASTRPESAAPQAPRSTRNVVLR